MLDTRMLPPPTQLPDYNYPVSPRENMELVFEHKVPYWVPNTSIDLQMTFCPADLERPGMLMQSGYDWFGLYWEYVDSVGAQMVRPGGHLIDNPSGWKEKLIFPDLDKIDFSVGAEEEYKRLRQKPDIRCFTLCKTVSGNVCSISVGRRTRSASC